MRSDWCPSGVGRIDPRRSKRSGQQGKVHPASESREYADHRSHRGNLLAQLTYKPYEDEETTSRFAGPEIRSEGSEEERRDQLRIRCHTGGAEEHRKAGSRLPDRDWR